MANSKQRSRALRVLGEIVAIVASILIAFAIQAWWESVQEGRTVRGHLQGIRAELEESRSQIESYVALVRHASLATRELLSLAPADLSALGPDSVAYLIDRSIRAGSITLPVGASEALIASGDLSLLENKALSSRIAAWPSMVRRAEDGGNVLRNLREEGIFPFLADYSASLTVLKHSGRLGEYPSSRLSPRFEEMLTDPEFEGHFALRALRLKVSLDDYLDLAEELDELMDAIERALLP